MKNEFASLALLIVFFIFENIFSLVSFVKSYLKNVISLSASKTYVNFRQSWASFYFDKLTKIKKRTSPILFTQIIYLFYTYTCSRAISNKITQIALVKSLSTRGASNQSTLMGNSLLVTHACPACIADELVLLFQAPLWSG